MLPLKPCQSTRTAYYRQNGTTIKIKTLRSPAIKSSGGDTTDKQAEAISHFESGPALQTHDDFPRSTTTPTTPRQQQLITLTTPHLHKRPYDNKTDKPKHAATSPFLGRRRNSSRSLSAVVVTLPRDTPFPRIAFTRLILLK